MKMDFVLRREGVSGPNGGALGRTVSMDHCSCNHMAFEEGIDIMQTALDLDGNICSIDTVSSSARPFQPFGPDTPSRRSSHSIFFDVPTR